MEKCKICGGKTRKGRTVCKGCHSVKRAAKSRENTPKDVITTASKHLDKNPGLLNISWGSFWKKNTKTIV